LNQTPPGQPDAKTNLEKLTADVEHFPVLPKVGTQLFQLLKDENRDAGKIAEVISSDPSLAAEILKLANSAYYQRQSKIATLKHAVAMIGVAEIEKMAMALTTGAMNRQKLSPDLGVDLSEFTAHLIMTAQISSYLVKAFKFSLATPAEAYAIAVLHDVGFLILGLNFPEPLLQAMNRCCTQKVPLRDAIREQWGVTPAQVGAWLLAKWQLPKSFIETVLYQEHGIPKRALMPEYSAILQVASPLATIFGLANPFEIAREPEAVPESTQAFLKKSGVEWDGDILSDLKGRYYDDLFEIKTKASLLTQASISYEEKAPAFIVRKPKPLG